MLFKFLSNIFQLSDVSGPFKTDVFTGGLPGKTMADDPGLNVLERARLAAEAWWKINGCWLMDHFWIISG